MVLKGKITGYDGKYLTATTPFSDTQRMIRQGITECEIRLLDGRTISGDQRSKIFATLRDISEWSGHPVDFLKDHFKTEFLVDTGFDWFSLSDCDMTTARHYLTYLIEFCLYNDIPCRESLLARAPDIEQYVYLCLKYKRCCIKGGKCELHHVDAVGQGRNRDDIIHLGMRVLPLKRKYHSEAHNMGRDSFLEKYHLVPVRLDAELCRIWNVKGE